MQFKPIRDRILVKPLEAETQTASGIVIPDSAQEKPQTGEVLATGTGLLTEDGVLIPLEVKVGDRVLFGKYAGQKVTIKDTEHIVLKEEDILAIVQ